VPGWIFFFLRQGFTILVGPQANSLQDPILKIPNTEKGSSGRVTAYQG
jgi:hypothetical protein